MIISCDSKTFAFNILVSNIPLFALWYFIKSKIPTKWQKIGTLDQIIIYPLKSGKKYHLTEGNCCKNGLKEIRKDNLFPLRDRYIVAYNADTKAFINLKTHFKLAFIAAQSISPEEIMLTAPDSSDLILKISTIKNQERFSMFYNEQIRTVDCGLEASQWISSYLNDGSTYKLGIWPENKYFDREELPVRWKKLISVYPRISKDYAGIYADIAGFMAVSQASLDDLNEKLQPSNVQVSHNNFRPNFVFTDMKAFDENNYEWFKIGESTIYRNFKPCTRCIITTQDPETGEKNAKSEPLRTLREYRAVLDPVARAVENNAPIFGSYLGVIETGQIKIGDPVYGSN